MTRTNKANDVPHNNPDVAATMTENGLPRFYGKASEDSTDPKKTKKDGGGRGNWGQPGDEIEDMDYNLSKPRRRSNSQSTPLDVKTKFEVNEADPVFEEDLHGPGKADEEEQESVSSDSRTSSTDATGSSTSGTFST